MKETKCYVVFDGQWRRCYQGDHKNRLYFKYKGKDYPIKGRQVAHVTKKDNLPSKLRCMVQVDGSWRRCYRDEEGSLYRRTINGRMYITNKSELSGIRYRKEGESSSSSSAKRSSKKSKGKSKSKGNEACYKLKKGSCKTATGCDWKDSKCKDGPAKRLCPSLRKHVCKRKDECSWVVGEGCSSASEELVTEESLASSNGESSAEESLADSIESSAEESLAHESDSDRAEMSSSAADDIVRESTTPTNLEAIEELAQKGKDSEDEPTKRVAEQMERILQKLKSSSAE